MITKFLHHGMKVNNLDESLEFYTSIGFKVIKRFKRDDLYATAAHVSSDGGVLELWQFDEPHPQHEYIAKHAALETDDLVKEVEIFKHNGYKEVIPITQGKTLKYAFLQDEQGNCIELGQR